MSRRLLYVSGTSVRVAVCSMQEDEILSKNLVVRFKRSEWIINK